ncbi:MAG: hypothetical protein ACO3JL_03925 [Myxococcota bacterium]
MRINDNVSPSMTRLSSSPEAVTMNEAQVIAAFQTVEPGLLPSAGGLCGMLRDAVDVLAGWLGLLPDAGMPSVSLPGTTGQRGSIVDFGDQLDPVPGAVGSIVDFGDQKRPTSAGGLASIVDFGDQKLPGQTGNLSSIVDFGDKKA